jgi:hypothetical protein
MDSIAKPPNQREELTRRAFQVFWPTPSPTAGAFCVMEVRKTPQGIADRLASPQGAVRHSFASTFPKPGMCFRRPCGEGLSLGRRPVGGKPHGQSRFE